MMYFEVLAKDLSGQNYCFRRLEIKKLGREQTWVKVSEVKEAILRLLKEDVRDEKKVYRNFSEVVDFRAVNKSGITVRDWSDSTNWDLIAYQFFTYPQRSFNWSDGQYWLNKLVSCSEILKFPSLF